MIVFSSRGIVTFSKVVTYEMLAADVAMTMIHATAAREVITLPFKLGSVDRQTLMSILDMSTILKRIAQPIFISCRQEWFIKISKKRKIMYADVNRSQQCLLMISKKREIITGGKNI